MYETFEHTADLGLRVVAPDLDTLFREAAEGLFSIIVEDIPQAEDALPRKFSLQGRRIDHLFFDWLSELLYVCDVERLVLSHFQVKVTGNATLEATALSQPLSPERQRLLHEVKAITYHGLRVEPVPEGWLAEVIVDI